MQGLSDHASIMLRASDVEAGIQNLIDNAYEGDEYLDRDALDEIVRLVLTHGTSGIRESAYQAGREARARELRAVLNMARRTLHHDAQLCRYHGDRFDFLGFQRGEPRCESCRKPWRVTRTLVEIDRALIDHRGEVGETGPDESGATRTETA